MSSRLGNYSAIPNEESEDEGFADEPISSKNPFLPELTIDHLLDPYAVRNIGILVSYFTVGVVSRLTQTPVEYYLIDTLGASSQQYSAYKVKYMLPDFDTLYSDYHDI